MIKKYLLLFWAFFRASFAADIEYRVNFGMRIFTDVLYYISQIAIFEVLFIQTDTLAGWTVHHARVFLGILFVVDALWMTLFSENLDHFSRKVVRGDLDLLLSKPVNSQFVMSFQKLATAYLVNLLIGTSYLVWALSVLPQEIPFTRIFWLFVLIPCGVTIMYCNKFFFAVSALFLTRSENLQHLWYQFHKLGTRPDTLYPTWLRYLVLSVFPVAFIASVPARTVLEVPSYTLIAAALALSVFCIFLSHVIWNYGLKHYSSASS